MKRETLDFTDKELTYIVRALEAFIHARDFYIPKKNIRVLNSAINKVVANGFTRSNPEKILYPLINFEKESYND